MNGHVEWAKAQFCLLLLTLLFIFSIFAIFKAIVWKMDSNLVSFMMSQAGAFAGAILLLIRPGGPSGRSEKPPPNP